MLTWSPQVVTKESLPKVFQKTQPGNKSKYAPVPTDGMVSEHPPEFIRNQVSFEPVMRAGQQK